MKCLRARLLAVFGVAALVIISSFGTTAYAVPAPLGIFSFEQPDGTTFNGYIKGDEFQLWCETADGHTIIKNAQDGFYEYADTDAEGNLKPTGIRVDPNVAPPPIELHKKPKRNEEGERRFKEMMQKGRTERTISPSSIPSGQPLVGLWSPMHVAGQRHVLVILVNFSDRSLTTTASDWYNMVFDTTPGVKSVANYYTDNSFGALSVLPVDHSQTGNPCGVISVSISQPNPNYGTNYGTHYTDEITWINAALVQAASYVDFPALDTNHDNIFDDSELVVYFVCAGYEATCAPYKTPNIGAHTWGGSGVSAGGISLSKWAVGGELNNYDVHNTMGTIAHELGHSMCGLPDLYDTTYTNLGLGAFSLMAYGSWGKTPSEAYIGTTPVCLDAWSREYLGWSTPRSDITTGSVSFPLPLSSATATEKLINTTVSPDQYFLVENRYPTGWDEGLERDLGSNFGGGLLIMHIDNAIGTPGANDINIYVAGSHQGVMAEVANGTDSLFYSYNNNNNNFGCATTPNSSIYDGTATNLTVNRISSRSDNMTAYLTAAPPDSATVTPSLTSMSAGTQVTFTASASGGTGPYEYKFWLVSPNGTWTLKQDYSTTTTWSWTPSSSDIGNNSVQVYARNVGSSADYEQSASCAVTVKTPPSGATLTASSSYLNTGSAATFTASASGGTGPYEYKFWLVSPGGTWTLKQDYSFSATWSWTTSSSDIGSNRVIVWVRNQGSPANWEAYADCTVTVKTPPSSATQTAYPTTLRRGEVFTFDSSASGGTGPYEYQYWWYGPGTNYQWTLTAQYTPDHIHYWPALITKPAGNYLSMVYVRNVGSPAAYEAYAIVSVTVLP